MNVRLSIRPCAYSSYQSNASWGMGRNEFRFGSWFADIQTSHVQVAHGYAQTGAFPRLRAISANHTTISSSVQTKSCARVRGLSARLSQRTVGASPLSRPKEPIRRTCSDPERLSTGLPFHGNPVQRRPRGDQPRGRLCFAPTGRAVCASLIRRWGRAWTHRAALSPAFRGSVLTTQAVSWV